MKTDYERGWYDSQKNVRIRLTMLRDTYISSGSYADAARIDDLIRYLMLEVKPYDEDEYLQQLENDGF